MQWMRMTPTDDEKNNNAPNNDNPKQQPSRLSDIRFV